MAERYDEEKLLAYVEGDMPHGDLAAFEAQLANDPQLRVLVEGMIQDREALRRLGNEAPAAPPFPADLIDTLTMTQERQMLLDGVDPRPPSVVVKPDAARSFKLHRWVTYAATAAVLLVCGSVIYITLTDFSLKEQADQLASSEPQPPGERVLAMGKRSAGEGVEVAEQVDSLDRVAEMPSSAALSRMDRDGQPAPLESTLGESFALREEADAAEAEVPTVMLDAGDQLVKADETDTTAPAGGAIAGAAIEFEDGSLAESSLALADDPANAGRGIGAELDVAGDAYGEYKYRANTPQPIAPGRQVVVVDVYTDDVEETNRVVLAWAYSNHVNIMQPPITSHDAAARGNEPAQAELEPVVTQQQVFRRTEALTAAPAPQQEVTLEIADTQVAQLVDHLNDSRRGRQRALQQNAAPSVELRLLQRPELMFRQEKPAEAKAADTRLPQMQPSLGITAAPTRSSETRTTRTSPDAGQTASGIRRLPEQLMLQVRIHEETEPVSGVESETSGPDIADTEPAKQPPETSQTEPE